MHNRIDIYLKHAVWGSHIINILCTPVGDLPSSLWLLLLLSTLIILMQMADVLSRILAHPAGDASLSRIRPPQETRTSVPHVSRAATIFLKHYSILRRETLDTSFVSSHGV